MWVLAWQTREEGDHHLKAIRSWLRAGPRQTQGVLDLQREEQATFPESPNGDRQTPQTTQGKYQAAGRDQVADGQERKWSTTAQPRIDRKGPKEQAPLLKKKKPTLQTSIKEVARERGMESFPNKMNQQSPKLILMKIHGGPSPFVSWRKENIETKTNFRRQIRPGPRNAEPRGREKAQNNPREGRKSLKEKKSDEVEVTKQECPGQEKPTAEPKTNKTNRNEEE